MTIEARVIADSTGDYARRLTTFQLRYPRFIHAEVMTHRVFSRNASSSRAIPVKRLIEDVLKDPATPIHWGKNQPGMQAAGEHDELVLCPDVIEPQGNEPTEFAHAELLREDAWLTARNRAVEVAQAFSDAGYHKQIVNRLLEPWAHINVVVTATNYDNFYWLRRHPDAQPEIKMLADAMWEAQQASEPTLLQPRQWHLPYVTGDDWNQILDRAAMAQNDYPIDPWTLWAIKVSVARCARVSYLTHDGKKPDIAADLALYDRLVGAEPLHASPAEHQATPDGCMRLEGGGWFYENEGLSGNLDAGWVQYRKTLPGEYCDVYEAA